MWSARSVSLKFVETCIVAQHDSNVFWINLFNFAVFWKPYPIFVCLLLSIIGRVVKIYNHKGGFIFLFLVPSTFYFIYFEAMLLGVVSYFLHFFVTSIDQMFNIGAPIAT